MPQRDEQRTARVEAEIRPLLRSGSDVVHGLLLLTLMLAVFAPTLSYDFVYDDHYYIVRNRRIAEGLTLANVKWSFTTYYFANWHPLTSLSYFADTSLFGKIPWGYRLTNILLHIVNTVLVFAVGKALTGRNGLAWWMAGVFALHPLHLESVVWISSRKDVLSILFGLWGILAYVQYAGAQSAWRYAGVCGLLSLSLLSKQTVITFPFFLLLLDAWPLRRMQFHEPGWPRRLGWLMFEKVPMLGLSVFFGIAAINAQKANDALATGVSLTVRVINAVNSVTIYLRQTVWPTGLCAFYPHQFDKVQLDGWVIASAVLLTTVCSLSLWTMFSRRSDAGGYVATGWFWFLGTLMPMIGLVQLGSAAHSDRYMYFPMVGLSLLVGMFVCRLANAAGAWGDRVAASAAYASVLSLAFASSQQVKYWENDVTLFRRALSVTPDNASSRINLADGLITAARRLIADEEPAQARKLLLEARDHAQAALRIRSANTAYYNLVTSLRLLGDYDEAIEAGRTAVEKFPEMSSLWFCLGEVYHETGDAVQATECYLKAIELFPSYVDAYNRLAVLNAEVAPNRAEEYCRQALEIDRLHVEARTNLGNALLRQERFEEAIREYLFALELDPGNELIQENLQIAERRLRFAEFGLKE